MVKKKAETIIKDIWWDANDSYEKHSISTDIPGMHKYLLR